MGRARYLVVTGLVAAFAGCGGDDDAPDVQEVERDLGRMVQEQTGTRDPAVSCPEDVEEGDACEVTAAGGVQAKVKVTRIDEGRVEGEVLPP